MILNGTSLILIKYCYSVVRIKKYGHVKLHSECLKLYSNCRGMKMPVTLIFALAQR